MPTYPELPAIPQGDTSTPVNPENWNKFTDNVNAIGTELGKGVRTYSVLAYGATGDGTTDDTSAIQAAIDAAKSYYTPGILLFPAGKYRITSVLTIDRRINIQGCGRGSQIFQASDDHLFRIDPYLSGAAHNLHMADLTLGSAATTAGKALIYIGDNSWGASGGIYDRITLAGGAYGIRMTNSHNCVFNSLVAYTNISGFFGTCASPARWVTSYEADCNAISFNSPDFNLGGWSIYWTAGEVLTIIGAISQGAVNTGAYIASTNKLSILNMHFESTATNLHLTSCVNVSLQQVGQGGGTFVLDGCDKVHIENCKFSGAVEIKPNNKRISIAGMRYGGTIPDIAEGTTDVRGLESSANAAYCIAGSARSSNRNLIDGDMAVWKPNGAPVGLYEWDASQISTQESTIIQIGSYSAKVEIGAGRDKAGLFMGNLDYDGLANKHLINYRTSEWSWIASGSGTNEYVLKTSAGADPDLCGQPKGVKINGSWADEGTMGSLAEGEWDYGDNDSLGYSTIYIRNNGGDPDSEAGGFVTATFTSARITLSAWVYKESGTTNPYLGVQFGAADRYFMSYAVPIGTWTRISGTFDIRTGYTVAYPIFGNCWFGQGTPGDVCYWSGCEVLEGDAASPRYDDSRGISGAFRVGGRLLTSAFANFTANDATPDVAGGTNFKTANAAGTTITMFDSGVDGQEIFVVINDANTTIDFTGTHLKGNAGANWSPGLGDHMRCKFDGTDWHCDVVDCTA